MSMSRFDRWLTSQPEAPECPECEGTGTVVVYDSRTDSDKIQGCTMCDGTGIRPDDYDDGRAEDPWR